MKIRSLFSFLIVACFVFSVALAGTQKTKTSKKTTASKSTASCCMSGSKADKASNMKDCPAMKDGKTAGKGCCSMQKSGKMSSSKSSGKMDCCAQHKTSEAKTDTKSGKSDKVTTEGEKN